MNATTALWGFWKMPFIPQQFVHVFHFNLINGHHVLVLLGFFCCLFCFLPICTVAIVNVVETNELLLSLTVI